MPIGLLEALILIGVGGVALLGSIQLDRQLGPLNLGGVLGPARYTIALSALILCCAALLILQRLRGPRPAPAEAASPVLSARATTLTAVLLAYVAAAPLVGFVIGSLVFFPLLYQVCGVRPWSRSAVYGAVMAVAFYAVFIWLARIPVPRGGLGF